MFVIKYTKMKKGLLFIFSLILLQINAQVTITNGDMESWQNVGSATEEPTQWNSNKTGSINATSGPQTCFRDVSPNSGTYCAKVKTGSTFGIAVNGSLTTGKVEAPNFTKSEGYIQTIPTNSAYAMTFVGRPDSLVFYYKYTRAGSDYPRVEARLHVSNATAPEAPVNSNHPDYTANIIARAQWVGSTTSPNASVWTRVAVPFVYVDSRTPQYILITTTSTADQNGGTSGSTLWLDDFQAIYTASVNSISPLNYYVSATAGASVTVPFTLGNLLGSSNVVTAQLSDAAGSFTNPVNIGTTTTNVSGTINATIPANTPTGTGYRIRVICNDPNVIGKDNGANITITNVSNAITPSASQSILVGANGNLLTVNETLPASTRTWKYATVSGGPYTVFSPAQTGTTYMPNFAAAGNYFVICESTIQGLAVISNEVEISVSTLTLTTGAVVPLYYEFSASATNASVNVPFTITGTYNAGNIFTAQLSDATGSFATPVNIGTLSGTSAGTINAAIPSTTPSGSGYRIRVIASNPIVNGADNGANITINQFANSISDTATQNIYLNTNGNTLTVAATQTATHEWKYGFVSGGANNSFPVAVTGSSYAPNFNAIGTYYVAAFSKNSLNDVVKSAEVQVNVTTGLATGSVNNLLYEFSASAPDATFVLPFTALGSMNPGNVFTAKLFDPNNPSFVPLNVGTKSSVKSDSIVVTIPHTTIASTTYKIRVESSTPILMGTDNGQFITIDQFKNAITPADTQNLYINTNGTQLVSTESQTATREWKYATASGGTFQSLNPARTLANYRPNFSAAGTYYVSLFSKNQYNDIVQSNEVVVIVTDTTVGISDIKNAAIILYQNADKLIVDLSKQNESNWQISLFDITGKEIKTVALEDNVINQIPVSLANGIYIVQLTNRDKKYATKIVIK